MRRTLPLFIKAYPELGEGRGFKTPHHLFEVLPFIISGIKSRTIKVKSHFIINFLLLSTAFFAFF
jgi:hypothetical protein